LTGQIYVLTNEHVFPSLYFENNSNVFHPSPKKVADNVEKYINELKSLQKNYKPNNTRFTKNVENMHEKLNLSREMISLGVVENFGILSNSNKCFIDANLVKINENLIPNIKPNFPDEVLCDGVLDETKLVNGMQVSKYGAKSFRTYSNLFGSARINFDSRVTPYTQSSDNIKSTTWQFDQPSPDKLGFPVYSKQLLFKNESNRKKFAKPGDSGSVITTTPVVADEDGTIKVKAIGLFHSVLETTHHNYYVATPFQHVLNHFENFEIFTNQPTITEQVENQVHYHQMLVDILPKSAENMILNFKTDEANFYCRWNLEIPFFE
jgi:hypothetical protein